MQYPRTRQRTSYEESKRQNLRARLRPAAVVFLGVDGPTEWNPEGLTKTNTSKPTRTESTKYDSVATAEEADTEKAARNRNKPARRLKTTSSGGATRKI